jgi:D-alanyl-D-alanine carboxypeptidase (penicillin-binding protein 5/6)
MAARAGRCRALPACPSSVASDFLCSTINDEQDMITTHRSNRRVLLLLAIAALLASVPRSGLGFETAAKQALIVDFQTGSVLLEKNADEPVRPASMTKLMTLYLLFEQLKQGKLSLDDTFTVSETAWARGQNVESNMFVALGSSVRIEDLIRGIAIQSGNDACKVVAEGIAGSESAFVERMNGKAAELGLADSHFVDSDGMDDTSQVMTARDIAKLSQHLYTDFPEYYHYFAEKEFTYNGIVQQNRNLLLNKDLGVDGLKTGHLSASGFGVAVSAEQGGRRIFMVVHGLESMKQRAEETARLVEWAFQSFRNVKLASAGQPLEEAPVWYGDADTVPLTIASDLVATLPRGNQPEIEAKAVFEGPIQAPIAAGQPLGKLVVTSSGGTTEVPLVAGAAVERVGFFGHIFATLKYLVFPQG